MFFNMNEDEINMILCLKKYESSQGKLKTKAINVIFIMKRIK